MIPNRNSWNWIIFLLSFSIYLFTLAPTLVWGDSPKFAFLIYSFNLTVGACSHPLYILLGKIFTLLPIGDFTYSLNLLSALFGALTISIMFAIIYKLTTSKYVAFFSAVGFCVSHTLWFLSVTTEVYTLHIFFIALIILILIIWYKKNKEIYLYLFAFILGLALTNHLMTIFFIPGFIYFILSNNLKSVIKAKVIFLIIISFLIGSFFILIILFSQIYNEGLLKVISAIIGEGMQRYYFTYSIKDIIKEIIKYIGYLIYQFPVIGFLIGISGMVINLNKNLRLFIFLILLFLPLTIFIINYEMIDKPFLYLSSYLIFTIWIGIGLKEFIKLKIFYIIGTSLILFPIIFYFTIPLLCSKFNIDIVGARYIPYRDNNWYFLFPPKSNYFGAYNYGQEVLNNLDKDSQIIADFTPFVILKYFQIVEKKRLDVKVIWVEHKLTPYGNIVEYIDNNINKSTIYLAATLPETYDIFNLKKKYRIIPDGLVYRINWLTN